LRFEFRDVEHLRSQYGQQQRHSLLSRELKAPEILAAHPDRAAARNASIQALGTETHEDVHVTDLD
jgi:hypothetical protein